ncbi:hypothetical protein MTO96_039427 [Rhipicephalus appendiculatus]
MCLLLQLRCKQIIIPFFQLLLPGWPHRSLLLSQLLRCKCHNLLACIQLQLVMCSLSQCQRRLLPLKQPGGRSEERRPPAWLNDCVTK